LFLFLRGSANGISTPWREQGGARRDRPPKRQKIVLVAPRAVQEQAPAENAARLAYILKGAGAIVDHRTVPTGHGLSQADVALTKAWLDQRQSQRG
jgi:predicted esterase